ncbi:TPA: hypothetical protein ACOTGN_000689 [Clostridium perfringens]|uniref:hypothetical protein n=1 Tax=Clostridium perfringens TaxID=1502 RepID=UPI00290BD7D0|nr:hypothetical protein [Clostridium perfringens]MDM0799421.1 hypothetical protein [Clostridium perfringens]MDM0826354.1 hypothetical protein [Clostridium perfringens]MDM0866526.1 hypothetical protein [Clostridium perfringens]MDU6894468.1 hypothetical protein [Clostridium perfringens]
MSSIGKTETGKLYHIVNKMKYNGNFSLCGVYMPKEKLEYNLNAFELYKEEKMCEKCMNIAYFN